MASNDKCLTVSKYAAASIGMPAGSCTCSSGVKWLHGSDDTDSTSGSGHTSSAAASDMAAGEAWRRGGSSLLGALGLCTPAQDDAELDRLPPLPEDFNRSWRAGSCCEGVTAYTFAWHRYIAATNCHVSFARWQLWWVVHCTGCKNGSHTKLSMSEGRRWTTSQGYCQTEDTGHHMQEKGAQRKQRVGSDC